MHAVFSSWLRRFSYLLLGVSLLSSSELRGADSPVGIEFFEKKIRPVLVAKCYSCHSAEAKEVKGGLLLDSREGIRKGGDFGPAVVPGSEAESLLLDAIQYKDGLEMPPTERLSPTVVADFAKWIASGAPDPRDANAQAAARTEIDVEAGRQHWAYQPISRPAVPATQDANWPRTDIDRFILAGLEAERLRPVADAAPLELLRRISFDLAGLPPTPEMVASFAAQYAGDPTSAVTALIDQLLASPRFGERWGRHWLDVVRYAESNGGNHNILFPLTARYREYVIDAINGDKPYDQFLREQIAGDLLPADSDAQRNEQLIATGFLTLGVKEIRERNGHRFRMSLAEGQIDVVGRALLAQTIACAQCHDHKYDPIPTRDYYALAGIFYSSQPRLGVRTYDTPYVHGLQPLAGSGLEEFGDRELRNFRQKASYATNASKALRDEKHRVLRDAGLLNASSKAQEEFLKKVPSVQKAASEKEQRDAELRPIRDRYLATMRQSVIAVRDVAQPQDLPIHIRGEDSLLGEIVPRAFPQVLTNDSTPQVNRTQSGRLELADWIASPENPLTARVMVNRVWQHLFGTGLVESPDNFGTTGPPPSNPALLDYLAQRFIAERWSTKSLIREIMLSRAYQLSSNHDPAAWEADPDNRLHWRMNRRRLNSDALFDAMLLITGELNLERPPLRLPIVDGVELGLRMKDFRTRGEWFEAVANHRTVYHPIYREYVPHDWSVFDFPDPDMVMGRRDVTTVPTQALYMMNSSFVVERSQRLAKRIRIGSERRDDAAAVRQAYLHVLARYPTQQEVDEGLEFLHQFTLEGKQDADGPLAAFCQVLFASAEFRYTY